MSTPPQSEKKHEFEDSLAELEKIVSELEAGERPLDESLALYERGMASLKQCHQILDKAEKRIRLLVQGPAGEPQLQDDPSLLPNDKADCGGDEKSENSLDADDQKRQNPSPSRSNRKQTNSGGSLFGRTK